jgi:hypothetical protein
LTLKFAIFVPANRLPCSSSNYFCICIILWRNRSLWEVIKIRNLKERDCTTVAERCCVLPPLPSPRFASLRVLLGYAVITWSRNSKEGRRDLSDVTRNNRSRVTFSVRSALTNSTTEFSVMSAPRLYNATLGIFARNCQTVNKYLVMSPRRGSTPRQTD